MRRGAVTVLLWWATQAVAAGGCAPLGEMALRSQLLDLRAALELDQQATHDALVDEVASRVPCLTFAPAPKLWATFLVHLALREFAAERDWQRPLAAALRINPFVDRGIGPGHPMFGWQASELAVTRGRAGPSDLLLYVDGDPALAFPDAEGVHLVQLYDGRFWASALLVDTPVPEAWLAGTFDAPLHVAVWATVSTGVAGIRHAQRAVPAAADWFADRVRGAPGLRVGGDVRVAVRSPLGGVVAGEGTLGLGPGTSTAILRAGASASGRQTYALLGAGLVAVPTLADGGAQVQRAWLAFPFAGAGMRAGDVEVRGWLGMAPAVQVADAELALLRGSGRALFRAAVHAGLRQAQFEQAQDTGVRVNTSRLFVGAELGAALSTER